MQHQSLARLTVKQMYCYRTYITIEYGQCMHKSFDCSTYKTIPHSALCSCGRQADSPPVCTVMVATAADLSIIV